MTKKETLADARSEAERARDALRYHSAQMRDRLRPSSLIEDAKDAARKRALELATVMLTSKRGRPVVAAGAVAAGTAYLLRKPLAHLVNRTFGKSRTVNKDK